MKYDPSLDNIPKPNLPHLHLEDLIGESELLDDHGSAILGDRAKPAQFTPEHTPHSK